MGAYSDSDDDYHKKKKRKKRRSRSRSKSYEGTPDSYSSKRNSSKHKKKKSKHKRKSSSRSPDLRKRSRSKSYERRRSRSTSRGRFKRSRSRDRNRRSRERTRRSKSNSRSPRRYRRSRSTSRTRHRRSRSTSKSRQRRVSPYSRRSRSRSYSPIRKKSDQQIKIKEEPDDPCLQIPGFKGMTPAEQTQARLQLALKAAAAADEKLKEQGLLPSGVKSENSLPTLEEQQRRQKAIEEIESTDFIPTDFVSSRTQKAGKDSGEFSHEKAMFGGDIPVMKTESKGTIFTENDTLMHPSLYVNQEERWELWRQKLIAYRKRKLEGEAMV